MSNRRVTVTGLLLATFMLWAPCVCGVAVEEDAPFPPKDTNEAKPEPPAPEQPAATPVARPPVTHKPWSDELRAFCAEHKIEIKEHGDLQVKLLLIGGAQAKAVDILRLAKQTLDGYELWSGQQELFSRKVPIESETYHLVVFKSDADYAALIDDFRAKNLMKAPDGTEDLAKKLAGFPQPRMMFSKQQIAEIVPENWAIYSTSCLALDAFYNSRSDKKRGPAWIREGMAAEMQRLQCKGSIKCTTIAYEDNKEAAVDNWPREVANMLSRHDPKLITANSAMNLPIDSLAGAHYRQMWSLLAFVRQNCGTKKGPENKFFRLLEATATGTDSATAVKTILGISDPKLTEAWQAWIRTLK
ncbi:MAG TPA: hypothetical protein VHX44_04355 [Planctomycetota bacterium]|nr:hypothetical protein [Planctomycetota bacterium]